MIIFLSLRLLPSSAFQGFAFQRSDFLCARNFSWDRLPLTGALQQHRHMRDRRIVGAHAFRRFCLDPDLIWLYTQQLCNPRLDFLSVWNDLGFGQNQRGINVAHFVSGKPNLFQRFFKKDDRVGAFPLGIGRRESSCRYRPPPPLPAARQ